MLTLKVNILFNFASQIRLQRIRLTSKMTPYLFWSGETMKVRASIKADPSKGDKIVRRKGRIYVINPTDPNRKQRQKGPGRKK